VTEQHNSQTVVWTVLLKATPILAKFLKEVLPQISSKWWDELVVPLTDERDKEVVQENKNSLDSLDISLLLKVFDRNWFDILSIKKDLLDEARGYAQEVKVIRNNEAHPTSKRRKPRDIRNDLASISRFSRNIGADESFLDYIGGLKDDLEPLINDVPKRVKYSPEPNPPLSPPLPESKSRSKYDPFWVSLKSNIAQLFDEAYNEGESSKIDVSGVRSFGYRPRAGWYGTALVFDDEILDAPMAHAMSLARVSVVEERLNQRYKGVTFELYVSSKCELHIEKIRG